MDMVGVLLKFTARPGGRDALIAHLTETAALAADESGTMLWTVNASPVEQDVVWVYEAYADAAAKSAHESGDAYARARARTAELLGSPPEAFPLIPLSGKGLPTR